jgi:DNA-binding NtrC family response regulator
MNPTSVLFVSHDPDLRASASRVLTKAGCRVRVAAHSGHASLACIASTYDVLVVDRLMADGSSDAVADRFRHKYPEANIVWVGDDDSKPAGQTGDLAVARPFDAYELIGAVSDATFLRAAARNHPVDQQQQYRAAN